MFLPCNLKIATFTLGFVLALGCGRSKPPTPPAASGPGEVLSLTDLSFKSLMSQGKPVLVDFWAPWCGPCRIQGPILDRAAAQIGDRALVGKVNVDEEKELARRFQIRSIPTLILFKDGKEVQRFRGVQQADTLIKAMKE